MDELKFFSGDETKPNFLVVEDEVMDVPEFSGSNEGAKNTDVEIWRKIPDDYYSPSIHVTEQGDIGIKVGGYVLVAPIERWFAAGEVAFCVEDDYIVRMPPVREYTVRTRIKSVEKAMPPVVDVEEYNLELARMAALFDECQSCRYGSCDACPPLHMEFKAWDELSDEALEALLIKYGKEELLAELRLKAHVGDEALENFEKLVEESEPSTFWEKIRNLASIDDWIDWLMGR